MKQKRVAPKCLSIYGYLHWRRTLYDYPRFRGSHRGCLSTLLELMINSVENELRNPKVALSLTLRMKWARQAGIFRSPRFVLICPLWSSTWNELVAQKWSPNYSSRFKKFQPSYWPEPQRESLRCVETTRYPCVTIIFCRFRIVPNSLKRSCSGIIVVCSCARPRSLFLSLLSSPFTRSIRMNSGMPRGRLFGW